MIGSPTFYLHVVIEGSAAVVAAAAIAAAVVRKGHIHSAGQMIHGQTSDSYEQVMSEHQTV